MNDVIKFLTENGFESFGTSGNTFKNDKCIVTINIELEYYSVANKDNERMYSPDLNIYWLIGVLTYYGYIDKNYK